MPIPQDLPEGEVATMRCRIYFLETPSISPLQCVREDGHHGQHHYDLATFPPRESVLEEAERIINGQRRDDYGDVLPSFVQIADLWNPILGVEITPQQVALCMIQLKIGRYLYGHTRDSVVDIAGYAGCLEKIEREAGDWK